MRRYFYLPLISSAFTFALFGCAEKKENLEQFSQQRIKTIIDSIGSSNIIAYFYETGGLSVMQFENKETHKARKLV
ncbi:MAG: hypothetical protein SGJ15_10795 [Bacteroidota bacterium]|nr:hypothetical protein [Bacteroidota bacterium]